MHVIINPAGY